MPGVFFSKRNVLFDLDGTLVDSSPAHARAFIETLAIGHSDLASHFDYARVAGMRTRDVLLGLGLTADPELTTLTQHKQQLYRHALERGEIPVFPGAETFVARLHGEGRRLFLVTGASRASAEGILKVTQLAGYFSGVIAAEDVFRGKPDPEPYFAALKVYALDRIETVAIEDGENGLRSALTAGLDVVALHRESHFPATLHAGNFADLALLFAA
jgi:HAD superfamily hydrolase (TIGR01509 family)